MKFHSMMVTVLVVAAFLLFVAVLMQIRMHRRYSAQAHAMRFQGEEIQKQLEALKVQNQELEQLYKEKQQILSVVSHDLRGPFNRIFALIQLMGLTAENLTDEQRDYLGKIHQIVADGLSMVRNLLDNRRLDDDRFEIVLEPLNISPILASLVRNYNILAEKKKIHIQFDAKDTVMVMADKSCLNRIMDNLLSNAIKFSPTETRIIVTARQDERLSYVTVSDEGPGISLDDEPKLFKKYQRLSAKPTGGESSTGLGLYLVHSLIQKMGGTIGYEREPGRGASFSLGLHVPVVSLPVN